MCNAVLGASIAQKRPCSNEENEMPVHFENPPVSEVVIATSFDPPLADLRSEHIGLFWREIRDDFPLVRQQPPTTILDPFVTGAGVDASEVFPMPRYWFLAEDGINLIQVQKDAFMLNWRRQDAAYPGFTRIKPAFDRYYTVYSDFVRSEFGVDLCIASCELNYVNVVEQSEFWSGPSETQRVISSFWVPDTGLQTPDHPGFNCSFGYQIAGDLRIDIAVRSGSVTQQPEQPVLLFELKATGQPDRQTKSRADTWFDRAHDATIGVFLNLTNSETQRLHWQRKET